MRNGEGLTGVRATLAARAAEIRGVNLRSAFDWSARPRVRRLMA